ncbi:embryo-specific protein ATS3B [Dendrobium catenatum]|nr:embryo-specific protein ATS3B [Dendrobium catenatum]
MASARALFVGFVAALSFTTVVAEAANPHPHPHPQPHPHPEELEHQHQLLLRQAALDSTKARGCSYRVMIKTSCRSPRVTRDLVALSFGDAYNNQVYAPGLDDPYGKAFERCSTDTYDIAGPCGYGTCYLYLWRDGPDGWIPEWVEVYDPYYQRYITFYYGSPIPSGVWYGFNNCSRRFSSNVTTTIATGKAATATHDE